MTKAKLQGRHKYKNWWKPGLGLTTREQVSNNGNISLGYNLVAHYVCPILQKESTKTAAKGIIISKIESLENLQKKLPIIIAEIS
jgi:hypothetical protein